MPSLSDKPRRTLLVLQRSGLWLCLVSMLGGCVAYGYGDLEEALGGRGGGGVDSRGIQPDADGGDAGRAEGGGKDTDGGADGSAGPADAATMDAGDAAPGDASPDAADGEPPLDATADTAVSDAGSDADPSTDSALPCTPGAVRCDGDIALVCKEDGGGEEAVDCTEGLEACMEGYCEAPVGCKQKTAADTTPCDDGLFCTSVDACEAGECKGSGTACASDTCSNQSCNEDLDTCEVTPINEGSSCGSDLSCLGGTCTSSANCSGVCVEDCSGSYCDLACEDSTSCTTTCTSGQDCNTDCDGSDACTVSCSSGADCETSCVEAGTCVSTCESATSNCFTDCRDSEVCSATCSIYADCVTDCRGAGTCSVSCSPSSDCLLYCDQEALDNGDCGFISCSGWVRDCGDGLLSCGSSCPYYGASFPPSSYQWPRR